MKKEKSQKRRINLWLSATAIKKGKFLAIEKETSFSAIVEKLLMENFPRKIILTELPDGRVKMDIGKGTKLEIRKNKNI